VEILGYPLATRTETRRCRHEEKGASAQAAHRALRLHEGLAQGLNERASWARYLRLEGEHTDLRTVRKAIAWIRDELAAAARRENKPGTVRLILLDPDRIKSAPKQPTLAEFAQAQGMDDFSEA